MNIQKLINLNRITCVSIATDRVYLVFQSVCEVWDNVYDNICDAIEWLIEKGYLTRSIWRNSYETLDSKR